MRYIVSLMNNSKFAITEDDYRKLGSASGLVYIPSVNRTINTSSIVEIYSEDSQEDIFERKNAKVGTLHDGKQVIRHFGQWFMANGEFRENGIPLTRPDPTYYPEVAKDCVPTPQEYEKRFANLPQEERKLAIIGGQEELNRTLRGGGFQKVEFRHENKNKGDVQKLVVGN